jgi:hypothetical protein
VAEHRDQHQQYQICYIVIVLYRQMAALIAHVLLSMFLAIMAADGYSTMPENHNFSMIRHVCVRDDTLRFNFL